MVKKVILTSLFGTSLFLLATSGALAQNCDEGSAQAGDGPITIVVGYNDAFANHHGINTRGRVEELLAVTNDAFIEAGHPCGFEIVGMRNFDYPNNTVTYNRTVDGVSDPDSTPEPPVLTENLGNGGIPPGGGGGSQPVIEIDGAFEDLENGTGGLQALLDWQDESGADVRVFFRLMESAAGSTCGVAGTPIFTITIVGGVPVQTITPANPFVWIQDDPTGAFSCPDFVLTHELGHTLGGRHGFTFSFSSVPFHRNGAVISPTYATIMAAGSAGTLGRDQFSDPDDTCDGVPCGDFVTADMSRFIEEHEAQVDQYDSLPVGYELRASVLPTARAITMTSGATVTYSATVINPNPSGSTALNCGVELPGAEGDFSYQRLSGGVLTGSPNTEFSVPQGGVQDLHLAYTPSSSNLNGEVLPFEFYCDNRRSAGHSPGLNAPFITTSPASQPIPDVLSSAATLSQDGIVRTPQSGTMPFVGSTLNIGAAIGNIVISPASPDDLLGNGNDLGGAVLEICQTNALAQCVGSYSSSITAAVSSNPTFKVRVHGADGGGNPVDLELTPGTNRVFVEIRGQANGLLLGATSVAVCTTNNPNC